MALDIIEEKNLDHKNLEEDYYRDVASCNYGDMLWDCERNEKFFSALKCAINKRKKDGKKTHVLDIGTGTGLLSMMAVQLGADTVVACEMFTPVARCAKIIIAQNGFDGQIKIVNKRSTELTVGPNADLTVRADILVSEVFDTELIGEGALETFNHAHSVLLQPDAIVIPSLGRVFAQIVESDSLLRWNRLEDWTDGENSLVSIPSKISCCPGPPALFDFQMSQLRPHQFTALTEPTVIFEFDFMRNKKIEFNELKVLGVKATESGKAQMVMMWWDLDMDEEGDVLLSCAPVWAHPVGVKDKETETSSGNPALHIPWRDHWMQAVYFLPRQTSFEKGIEYTLRGWHDEFSLWFSVCECSPSQCNCPVETMPLCQCGVHFLASRTRLAAINDPLRRSTFVKAAKKLLTRTKNFIVLGDYSLIGFALESLGADNIHILVEKGSMWIERAYRLFMMNSSKIILHDTVDSLVNGAMYDKVCVLSEPFIFSSLLPWENLRLQNLKNELAQLWKRNNSTQEIIVCPVGATIRALCISFDDLWKISRPLVKCHDFAMNHFDTLISEAKAGLTDQAEPQPLWEYPCRALSDVVNLTSLNLGVDQSGVVDSTVSMRFFPEHGRMDGLAVWVDYDLGDGQVISTGPSSPPSIGQYVSWNVWERQGVLFCDLPLNCCQLSCNVLFHPSTCKLQLKIL